MNNLQVLQRVDLRSEGVRVQSPPPGEELAPYCSCYHVGALPCFLLRWTTIRLLNDTY